MMACSCVMELTRAARRTLSACSGVRTFCASRLGRMSVRSVAVAAVDAGRRGGDDVLTLGL